MLNALIVLTYWVFSIEYFCVRIPFLYDKHFKFITFDRYIYI